MNKGNPSADSCTCAMLDRFAIDPDFSLIRAQDSGKDPHKRRLARTVLAHQTINLACPDRNADVVDGYDPTETFCDGVGLNENRAVLSFSSNH